MSDLFKKLALSKQAKSIEILQMTDAVAVITNLLKRMGALTPLMMVCYSYLYGHNITFGINQLFEYYPVTLVSLNMAHIKIECIESTPNFTSIQSLTLLGTTLTPNILKLSLDGDMTCYITLSLPHHNSEKLFIKTRCVEGRLSAFSFKTMNNDKPWFYKSGKTDIRGKYGNSQTGYKTSLYVKKKLMIRLY